MSFKRVMSFAGAPDGARRDRVRGDSFPGFTLAELEEFHGSVYSFYETVFGVRMIRAEERLRAVAADRSRPRTSRSRRARRCCASTASPTRTATSRSSGAAACA